MVYQYGSVLSAEAYDATEKDQGCPVGNGPVSQATSVLLGGITLPEEIRRILSEVLDKSFDDFYGLKPKNLKVVRATRQH